MICKDKNSKLIETTGKIKKIRYIVDDETMHLIIIQLKYVIINEIR